MKLNNAQYIELLNSFILKHTDYDLKDFTGGSVSNTLTHNNTQIHYKVNLYFGYKSKKPITKTIEIDEDIYSIMYKAISLKVKSMVSKDSKVNLDSLKDLMGLSTSTVPSSSTSTVPSSSTSTDTPTNTNYLPTINTNTSNTIESDFETFWSVYPKKKSKAQAKKSFEKLHNEIPLIDNLIYILNRNINSEDWMKDDGKYIPHPSTWINGKRWLDEITVSSSNKVAYMLENNIYDIIDEMEAAKNNQRIINE